ncbi:3-oxoacyl-ACP synthase III family protein [Funiculus sociatus GB2-A5]|uniref:3-oxoacyl-ACP synthase III family protein n=1 Tax=Funiculus sociatus GB2-A5 TaxID=2933946 RepID=A0ABV0JT18_9CYAN|nr:MULTISPECIES: 3-oxoacyl-ACP synthase III family protein [unclassified Trichocoleus]MBD1903924.1 3-oxoacyl-ACP synthase III family protein [Trichocoleus sp. FACHB-832]MBD2060793.1 3-oxoacyl-ACP synthase III family protein [Trichocoleus sp. FACHB-6]
MTQAIGIRSIAVTFPSILRTNDYWRNKYPHSVTQAEQKALAKLFSASDSNAKTCEFDQEMIPYLSDPFRGAVERRVLAPDESSMTLEKRVAFDAIAAAEMASEDVDLMIVTSLFPERIAPGNASFLVGEMGLRCPAWNLESTCSSALVALQTANALVQAGAYRNVLVVISCIYSRFVDDDDTLSWFMGDGAGAFIVGNLKSNQGVLGTKIIHTAATCGAFFNELTTDAQGNPRMRIQNGKNASQQIRGTGVEFVRACSQGAVEAAGVTLDDIKYFAFNTPTAWYANLCVRALGIDPERTINLYPQFANIGPVLPIVNLYYGAQLGKVQENDLVLVYTIGSASTAAATVMRWGDVKLGPLPAPAVSLNEQEKRIPAAV